MIGYKGSLNAMDYKLIVQWLNQSPFSMNYSVIGFEDLTGKEV
jgi:hypothetical protein